VLSIAARDGDCLVALKGLEQFDNNHPVVVMIYNGEDVFVRLDGPRCLRGPLSKTLRVVTHRPAFPSGLLLVPGSTWPVGFQALVRLDRPPVTAKSPGPMISLLLIPKFSLLRTPKFMPSFSLLAELFIQLVLARP
jgi:hypothetical protein